jgi:hypothetical protein
LKKRNIAFCECGNPATVWTGDAKICSRCDEIESQYFSSEFKKSKTEEEDIDPEEEGIAPEKPKVAQIQTSKPRERIRLTHWESDDRGTETSKDDLFEE